jgi:hypothetical protein
LIYKKDLFKNPLERKSKRRIEYNKSVGRIYPSSKFFNGFKRAFFTALFLILYQWAQDSF